MSTSFTQVFGGTTIYPSDVSYLALALTGDISLEWPLEATTGNNVVARIIDITPTGAYTITMPDAMSVGVGQTVLFNNLGPNTVTVDNAAGTAILSIGAGEQWQAYLIDNTTIGGVWRTFRYGAAVAQAQAAALAGAGLIADGSELAQNYEVIDFSITPYGLTIPDRAKIFVWTGGLGTLTLPTAVSAGDGWFVQVRNGGQGDLTIDPSGSEFINAASTLRLQPGDSAVVVSDGVQWYTIGLGQQAVFAFDYTTIAVTGGTYTLSGSELNRIAYKFTGTLTSDLSIVVPATVQQYWVNNATTGAFTLALKTASGSPTLVDQNSTAILYCDGTTIVAATTSVTFGGILPVLQGGTGANNGPSALTNLGGTGIGTAVFTASTTAAARTAIAAAASGANSDITSLTGLTTPLSVGQGGTGATTLSSGYLVKGNGASAVGTSVVYDTGANVGIGTNTPGSKLEVLGGTVGTTAGDETLIANQRAVAGGNSVQLLTRLMRRSNGTDWTTTAMRLQGRVDVSDYGYIDFVAGGGANMAFGIGSTQHMIMDGSGNLGIGNSPSSDRINVGGNVQLSNTTYGYYGAVSDAVNAQFAANGSGASLDIRAISNHPMTFYTNNTERMRINASGNVGIGTSNPNYKLEANGIIASYLSGQAGYWTYNGGAIAEWFTGQRSGADHAYKISQVAAGVYTDRITVDTSGNVGIGTSSTSAGYGSGKSLTLTNQSGVLFQNASSTWNTTTAGGGVTYFSDNNLYLDAKDSASNMIFRVNGATERMRIDSSGAFLVGTTGGNVGYGGGAGFAVEPTGQMHNAVSGSTDCYYMQKDNTGGAYLKFFYGALNSAPSVVGDITTNGTGVSYNTSSDYRLKEIDGPIANSGAYIDALNPVQGSWKADGSRFIGLLAHEVQEVSETPIATGEKDGEKMQAMDYSAPELIANLIAEIQSLRARVAQLEGN